MLTPTPKILKPPFLTPAQDPAVTPVGFEGCSGLKKDRKATIWSAVQRVDVVLVRRYLALRKYTANQRNMHWNTPLYYCVQAARKHHGSPKRLGDCVRIGALLLHGGGSGEVADLHARNTIGETPLWLACKYSPIMAALFKRFLKWKGSLTDEEYKFLLRAREMGLKKEERMVAAQTKWEENIKRQKQEHREERRKKMVQKLGRREARKPRPRTANARSARSSSRKKSRPSTAKKEWRNAWAKEEVFLFNAGMATSTQQKMVEWNRKIRVRDRLDLMKLKTVKAYSKPKAEEIRKRLYRIERKKALQKEMNAYYRKRKSGYEYKNREKDMRHMLATIHRKNDLSRRRCNTPRCMPVPQPNENPRTLPAAVNARAPLPAGFFRLDTEADIKDAFKILAKGGSTIDKNDLIKLLMQKGNCLELDEAYAMLERLEGFRMSDKTHRVDFEAFIETMKWLSLQADAADAMKLSKISTRSKSNDGFF